MRLEISELHKKLATTMIYVTHDQIEAMTMQNQLLKNAQSQKLDDVVGNLNTTTHATATKTDISKITAQTGESKQN